MTMNGFIDHAMISALTYTKRGENLSSDYNNGNKFKKRDPVENNSDYKSSDHTNKEKNPLEQEKKDNALPKLLQQSRILIAESEPEICTLFKNYLDSMGAESVTVDSGDSAIDIFLRDKEEGKDYHAIILDTHLKGTMGLDTAKKIRECNSDQKIIIVTTNPKESLIEDVLKSTGIDNKNILVMPFRLSELISVIKQ